MEKRKERIVVLGGGAGGLELACNLAGNNKALVTLVDVNGSHVWKPRLHEFAAGTVDSTLSEMSFYMLAAMRGFTFEQGKVVSIDRQAQTVRLAAVRSQHGAIEGPERDVAYDRLVVALGGVTPDFGTTGVAEHAVRLDEKADADDFRDLFVAAILRSRHSGKPAKVSIVGSGATGTELASHLRVSERGFINQAVLESHQRLLDVVILEAAPEIMPGASDGLRKAVLDRLALLDIDTHTNAKIAAVERDAVVAEGGERWPTDITVWAAGLVGNPCLEHLCDFAMDSKHRIAVDNRLRTTVDERIYALGDAASFKPTPDAVPLPPTAQCASQQAAYLAGAIPKTIAGGTPDHFEYNDQGRLLSLARGGSVGSISPFRSKNDFLVHGQFARAAYQSIQRRHQWSVLGYLRGSVAIFADAISPAKSPALKLHG
ncbi:NADH dehydrogenase, FAD-containing subunit [Fulvimarina pelagi HTCC2506]|uniref:NADH dehydrogenase, FAD-containing subunit n=1 Tax=Fulvimarina pelagi HTCC2506 TaxID=314231 RepID=Q0G4H4_9HYPH|nr:FAD-dependent oxidoreductase [Fulvimarina pelagi]EAU41507.1 NADH dehydrogenase, FAD-containing subunit [Fulvimarina pelagi HTCC2506]